jgi:RNA polymerase sporulation-specific sigma factor
MNIRGYNDYELLYLINTGSDEALEIMLKKYEKLIYSMIHKFHVFNSNFDDAVQEARMSLLKSIKKYSEFENKTFTKFFELILERKLIDLYHIEIKNKKIDEHLLSFNNDIVYVVEDKLDNLILKENFAKQFYKLSSFEQQVYERKFIEKKKVREISVDLNQSSVKISNAIQRIKRKFCK